MVLRHRLNVPESVRNIKQRCAVWSPPECLGAIEAGMRLARAIEQLLNPRLLVAHDETRGKCAMAILLRGQTTPRTSDDIRA